MKRRILIGLIILSSLPALASANPIYVPDDETTIQAAIDAAALEPGGDVNQIVVIVRDGVWTGTGNYNLDFNDVNDGGILLRSENGPTSCIIDCQNNGRGMFFFNGEDETTVIKGFTIRNGDAKFEEHTNNDGEDVLFYEDGGGIYCRDASPQIINCVIENSYAFWYGGGIACFEGSSLEIINCLIKDNFADDMGGAIFCDNSSPVINACTITHNRAGNWYFNSDQGQNEPRSGIACLNDSSPDITNSVIWEQYQWDTVAGAWFGGDDLYECDATYSCIEDGIGGEATNTADNPEFRIGGFGDYYLAQLQAGNLIDSPCIDSGTGTIRSLDEYNIGRVTTSTSITYQPDRGYIDMGYHFPEPDTADPNWVLPTFHLQITVIGNGSITSVTRPSGGPLTVNAGGGFVNPDPNLNDLVTINVSPNTGYRVKQWTGTDNDTSTANSNTAFMDADKTVTVEFEFDVPRILYVGGDGQYPTIQLAIDDAHDGDTIQIAPANEPYQTSLGFRIDKNITITSANPDDPCVVASTVIEQVIGPDGWVSSAFRFRSGGSNAVLNGITMRNFRRRGLDGRDFEMPERPDGEYGRSVSGGAINCDNASPIIKNCVIYDCNIIGGDGGDGADGAGEEHPDGWDGGWPGFAYGGAIAIWPGSNPTIINTTFDNCVAFGGNGGDGGNGAGDPFYGHGGRAGGWTYAVGSWWYGTPWSSIAHDGFSTDYTRYGGLGGAIYVGLGASVSITDCNFINCRTIGGQTGIGGLNRPQDTIDEPSIRWRIDNFGGAIHFAGNNTGLIENCTFINNFADTNTAPDGSVDPLVSYGGAIDLEDDANVAISNCTFRGNSATIGGAVHGTWSDPVISDCNFWSNWAYHGAGALFVGGTIQIERSDFSGNTAVNAAAQGGGICSLGANGQIVDCNVSNNSAAGSGGGIYVSSKDVFEQTVSVEGPVVIKNCLITDNTAGRDGGGISANWYAEPNIINCTIANNTVTGIGFGNSYGGGLYSAYGNYSNVLNSILWGNSASNGTQIGIGNGAGNDPGSTVSVSYSDVQGEQAYVFFDVNCTLEWGAGNIHTDPLFVTGPLGDYYLSQIAAGQPVDSNCVDAGSDLAIDVGLHQYTTRTDEEVFDTNMVDMGYHYPLAHPIESCGLSDLSNDGIVNFADFAIFLLYWLDEDCSADNNWCGGADFTFDSYVNFDDLASLYGCWLVEDTNAPTPNPSRWEIEPYSTSMTPPYAVSMTAEEAFDNWGGVVEYRFECVTGNGSDRDWDDPNRTDKTYTDSNNLVTDTVYGYRVQARDEGGNETEWSVIRYAMTGEEPPLPEDHNPPTPNPMTWATEPYATSPTSIAMVATTATDDTAGVEYYFEDFNSPAVNSGWIGVPTWTDVGLTPETTYGYRVRARDTSAWQNETGWSDPCSATTPAVPPPPDTTPPTPDPSQFAVGGSPRQYGPDPNGYFRHTMTAEPASDAESEPVQYYFECVGGSSLAESSGWQLSNVYDYAVAVNSAQNGVYKVRTRDAVGNMSAWSDEWSTLGPFN